MLNKNYPENRRDAKTRDFAKSFLFIISFCLLLLAALSSCGKEEKKIKTLSHADSTAIKDSLRRIEEEKFVITYHYFPESGKTGYSGLKEKYSANEIKVILAVNRIDAKNFRTRDSVVVPDTFVTDFLRYSPFPRDLDIAKNIKKLLLLSHRTQSFGAYEYGKLVRWGPTSLGKKSTQTPNGLYHTNWKAKSTISTVNDEWILPWAFNLNNFEGISIHQFDLPGYPASHSCARLLEEDAQWFYYWAEQWIVTADQEDIIAFGTPVIIFGKYNYGQKPSWHFLPSRPDTTTASLTVLNSVIDQHLETILKRQSDRDSIVAERERLKDTTKK